MPRQTNNNLAADGLFPLVTSPVSSFLGASSPNSATSTHSFATSAAVGGQSLCSILSQAISKAINDSLPALLTGVLAASQSIIVRSFVSTFSTTRLAVSLLYCHLMLGTCQSRQPFDFFVILFIFVIGVWARFHWSSSTFSY